MMRVFLIAMGGAVGAMLRYALSGVAQRWGGGTFPVGTLVVNTVGCLLAGGLAAVFAGPHLVREEYRLGILIGLLGGFTTFSTFGWETMALAGDGQWRTAAINVVLNNGLGLAAAWAGYRVGLRVLGA